MSTPEQPRSPRRGMCAAVLALEGVVVGLSTPVMVTLGDVPLGRALAVGLGIAAACLLLAGLLRAEAAYVAGWVLQLAVLATGFLTPVMFFLGAVFAMLWATAYFLGRKIERERAAAYAAHAGSGPDQPA
jgi:hypothetical protein